MFVVKFVDFHNSFWNFFKIYKTCSVPNFFLLLPSTPGLLFQSWSQSTNQSNQRKRARFFFLYLNAIEDGNRLKAKSTTYSTLLIAVVTAIVAKMREWWIGRNRRNSFDLQHLLLLRSECVQWPVQWCDLLVKFTSHRFHTQIAYERNGMDQNEVKKTTIAKKIKISFALY